MHSLTPRLQDAHPLNQQSLQHCRQCGGPAISGEKMSVTYKTEKIIILSQLLYWFMHLSFWLFHSLIFYCITCNCEIISSEAEHRFIWGWRDRGGGWVMSPSQGHLQVGEWRSDVIEEVWCACGGGVRIWIRKGGVAQYTQSICNASAALSLSLFLIIILQIWIMRTKPILKWKSYLSIALHIGLQFLIQKPERAYSVLCSPEVRFLCGWVLSVMWFNKPIQNQVLHQVRAFQAWHHISDVCVNKLPLSGDRKGEHLPFIDEISQQEMTFSRKDQEAMHTHTYRCILKPRHVHSRSFKTCG